MIKQHGTVIFWFLFEFLFLQHVRGKCFCGIQRFLGQLMSLYLEVCSLLEVILQMEKIRKDRCFKDHKVLKKNSISLKHKFHLKKTESDASSIQAHHINCDPIFSIYIFLLAIQFLSFFPLYLSLCFICRKSHYLFFL